MKRILLVSEEIAGFGGSGGIGAAFEELAVLLAKNRHAVDFLLASIERTDVEAQQRLRHNLAQHGVRFLAMDWDKYAWNGQEYEKKSYTLYKHITSLAYEYDAIHFHDYKGLAYCSLSAQRQGLAFRNTNIVVQLHGPTRWTIEANEAIFSHPDQLRIDHMERECIRWANHLVSPSAYLVEWLREHEFLLPEPSRVHVIKNACALAARFANSFRSPQSGGAANEIVYFARHEDRKGFGVFCDAIDLIRKEIAARNVTLTFLGKLGSIDGRPSGIELTNRALKWEMPLKIRTQLDRYGALQYLADNDRSIVVIPSPSENSPYTVVEATVLEKPVVTSALGGAKELIACDLHDRLLAVMEPASLANRLLEGITEGLPQARLASSPAEIEQQWRDFHAGLLPRRIEERTAAQPLAPPKVVLGITHFERPRKLAESLLSAMRQDYENIEIVVVDDGSTSSQAREGLQDVERILQRLGGRLLRQDNAYLGAARNAIARATNSDYLIFLDDDDLAFKQLTSTLVKAAVNTAADIVGCFNIFMEEQHRAGSASAPEAYSGKVSYAPLGGPLSVAPFENWLGGATALIRRSHFERMNGYTELRKVGFEDYEFFFRSVQSGARLEMVPEALYLYEVGRPSMISRTPVFKNYRRILNSLDLTKNSRDWQDFVSMNTGRKALEERWNRIDWEFRTHAHAEHLLLLRDTHSSADEYATHLINYAAAVGAPHVARAWASSTVRGDRSAEEVVEVFAVEANRQSTAAVPTGGIGAADLDIVADLLLGRQDDAFRALTERITRAQVIDHSLAELLKTVAENAKSESGSAATELLQAAHSVKVRKDWSEMVGTSLALLGLKTNDSSLSHSFLQRCYALDEANYREQNPDVADAVENAKVLTDGLQHFERHGFEEKRPGYDRLRRICAALNRAGNLDLKPWTLAEALDVPLFSSVYKSAA